MTTPAAFTVSYPITVESSVDASRVLQGRRTRYLGAMAFGATALAGLAFMVLGDPEGGIVIVVASLAGIIIVATSAFLRFRARRRLRGFLGEVVRLTFDERGITFASSYQSGQTPWQSVTEIREDSTTVLFMRDRVALVYLPTSACSSPQERAAIVAFARARIGRPPAVEDAAPAG